ncbi:MAG: UDP-N-acetylmuramate dehydrogenase [Deltaproteobacteria bacterium]|nr:UDP-N-acetylmuramate dehydrogenase [Deltaproteobacteria bacterium]MCX7952028.1 UDP-N-acetylmuramate dehydrogenase [Deltaproteobacteria bacterium]
MKERDIFLKEFKRFLDFNRIAYKENFLAVNLTTLNIGGTVSLLVLPETIRQLCLISKQFSGQFFVLGNGSNTFIRGDFVKVPIIQLGKTFKDIAKISSNLFRVAAANRLDVVSRKLSMDSLSGLEFAVGIPGTVGGGVYMNAGAHGHEVSEIVKRVHIVFEGRLETIRPQFDYRKCYIPAGAIVIAADFELVEGDLEKIKISLKNNLEYRKLTQPLHYPSLGSVFKNPSVDRCKTFLQKKCSAGELLERCGLKGFSYGECKFSEQHANWIVNPHKKGTYEEVDYLIRLAKEKVKTNFAIDLELEWKILEG